MTDFGQYFFILATTCLRLTWYFPVWAMIQLAGVSGAIRRHLIVPSHSQEQCWPALWSLRSACSFLLTVLVIKARTLENMMLACFEIARWPYGKVCTTTNPWTKSYMWDSCPHSVTNIYKKHVLTGDINSNWCPYTRFCIIKYADTVMYCVWNV